MPTAASLTLTHWLEAGVADGAADAGLAGTLGSIAAACAEIATVLRTAPIAGISGAAGTENVQGEVQKQLDVVSNDIFIKHLEQNPQISILVSEELSQPLRLAREDGTAAFAVACDPLDGSSNLDVNVTVGSIFSVLRASREDELLQPGSRQVAAGYAAYGNSTSLVLTLGHDVTVFTLGEDGVFVVTAEDLQIPPVTAEFAINTARQRFWDGPTTHYVSERVAGESGPVGKRYNMRWVGSMVADIHRILMRGGIFLYPLDSETMGKGGRLRLMYEASPMAMIVEAAGGQAITGPARILDLVPTDIHQRVPVILGSRDEVTAIEALYAAETD
jgi:fructose-1,6-bisphosphatase